MRPLRALRIVCLVVAALAALGPGASVARPAPLSQQQIEAQFLTALTALNSGRPEEAIPPLLNLLGQDPSLVRVRLELARAYFEAEQWQRAREEFFIVLSGDLPDPVRQRVLMFIRAIDSRRSLDWDIDIALVEAGSNRTYDTDDVTLNFGGFALPSTLDRSDDSELGLQIITSVELRRPLAVPPGAIGRPSLFGRLELNSIDAAGSRFDDLILGARGGLRFVGPTTTTILAPLTSQRRIAGERFEDTVGLSLAHERRFSSGLFASGAATYSDIDNDIRDDQSGHQVQLFLSLSRSIGGRSAVGVSWTHTDKSVSFDLDNARSNTLRVFGTVETGNGFAFQPSVFVGDKHFKTPSPLFTADPDERSVGADLRIEKRDLFLFDGFTPYAAIGYERVSSDVDAYSYRSTDVKLGIERRF